jgi:hypothetical protein
MLYVGRNKHICGISLELPAWIRNALVKIMRVFLWTGTEVVQGGKCAVAWNLV